MADLTGTFRPMIDRVINRQDREKRELLDSGESAGARLRAPWLPREELIGCDRADLRRMQPAASVDGPKLASGPAIARQVLHVVAR
jgi:hypothetical protein